MGLFGVEKTRKILAVSLEPQTIVAMNKVIDTMGGKGNRSKWVEKVILRALKEDWQIEIVKPHRVSQKKHPYEFNTFKCVACGKIIHGVKAKDEHECEVKE